MRNTGPGFVVRRRGLARGVALSRGPVGIGGAALSLEVLEVDPWPTVRGPANPARARVIFVSWP